MKNLLLAFSLLVPCITMEAQTLNGAMQAQKFVESYYRWYLPVSINDRSAAGFEIAIRDHSFSFSPRLLQSLQEESENYMDVNGECMGIKFDPFVNSMNHGVKFIVKRVLQIDNEFQVKIFFPELRNIDNGAEITAIVTQFNGKLVFSNFIYADKRDLLSILRLQQEDRQKRRK